MYLKACPRCRGDLIAEADGSTNYLSCLQCGHILTPAQESMLTQQRFGTARLDVRGLLQPSRRN